MSKLKSWPVLFLLLVALSGCDTVSTSKSRKSAQEPIEKGTDGQIKSLTAEIVDNPNDPNLYVKRALAYRDQRMLNLAIRDAERALSIDSTTSYFHELYGDIKFKAGQLRDARISLEKAVVYDDTNIDAFLMLAEVNYLLRRYEFALENVDAALRINDKLAQGYFLKGFIFKEIGDTTLSISSFQTAAEVNPDHFESYIELAHLYAFKGDPIAKEYFNTALNIRPRSAEAMYGKGMFMQAGLKFDSALAVYRKLIEIDPDNFLGFYNLGYVKLTEELDFDSALYFFDKALAIQPTWVEAVYNRGLCFEEMGDRVKAEKAYRRALSIDPQYTLAAKGLERILE